jgi:hypothetical protein
MMHWRGRCYDPNRQLAVGRSGAARGAALRSLGAKHTLEDLLLLRFQLLQLRIDTCCLRRIGRSLEQSFPHHHPFLRHRLHRTGKS